VWDNYVRHVHGILAYAYEGSVETFFHQNEPEAPTYISFKSPTNSLFFGVLVLQEASESEIKQKWVKR
jgi:hypothetical protein